MTLPLIYAREAASDADRALIDEAVKKGDGDFDKISEIVIRSDSLERCKSSSRKGTGTRP